MISPRVRALAALVLAAPLLLSACSSSEGKTELTPAQSLAQAKRKLDATSGVRIDLSTDKLPAGVSGILDASGVGTHAPAFEGGLNVSASGITADARVIAVDGKVYAVLPFTTDYTPIDPADYGAPDPAALMGRDGGLSSLLTSVQDVTKGKAVRDGADVLTEYTGTVPGEAVAGIIPSADKSGTFDAAFTLDKDNRLDKAVLTGPFYPQGGSVTYTIAFDSYGVTKKITAP